MRRLSGPIVIAAMLVTIVLPALAQQSGQSSDPHHPPQPGAAPGQPAPTQPAPGPGRGAMGMGDMMGGMMGEMHHGRGGGPLGLCPTAREMLAQGDARATSRSLKLCGELLKAMGDVLLKHSAELEKTGAGPAPGVRR